MSCLICCFKCLAIFGCRNKILNNYAFFPPPIAGYSINYSNDKKSIHFDYYDEDGNLKIIPDIQGLEYSGHAYKRSDGSEGCGIYIQYTKIKSDYIIIFSHGNSTDIGKMIESLLDLSYNLKTNVFGYEYTGYATMRHKNPSDENLIFDIQEAYNYVIKTLNYPWHKIILYGQSVGSGPSTYLASNYFYPTIGLILHSPILSGLRIIDINMKKTPKYDFFPNFDLIKFIKCPVFIIHGQQDNEVPIEHSKILLDKCQRPYDGWWVPEAGHNNIDIKQRKDYFMKIFLFIKALENSHKNISEAKLLIMNQADEWSNSFVHFYNKFIKRKKNSDILINSIKLEKDEGLEDNKNDRNNSNSSKEENKNDRNNSNSSKKQSSAGKKGDSDSNSKIKEVEFSSRTSSVLDRKISEPFNFNKDENIGSKAARPISNIKEEENWEGN